MQRINRFARYWDMIGNSGRFKYSLPHILSDEPFDDFMAITEWIFNKTGQIHKINLKKLFELISQSVEALYPEKHALVIEKIEQDYEAAKLKSGSREPGRVVAGSITMKQAEDIAKEKMKDLNAFDIKEATKIICGSARSMGIEVKE